jgi:hypothetical protein
MAWCSYSLLLENKDPCGSSVKSPEDLPCIAIRDCMKDVSQHLKSFKVGNDEEFVVNEQTLLLARAGKL